MVEESLQAEKLELQTVSKEAEQQSPIAIPKIGFDGDWRKYAAVKVSSEFDSEGWVVINKISARVLDGLAKIKASFQRDGKGELRYPQLGLVTKYLSVLYDHDDRNALVTASVEVGRRLQFKLLSDVKAQQGEVKILTNLADSRYKAEVSYDVPSTGLPRATLTFPYGELKLEDEVRDEARALSINGFVVGNLMNGLCLAEYKEENLNLKYKYKDEEMTMAPCISLPSKELSFAFKRQFNPLNKLSYLYNFNSAAWSAVYKHKPNEDFKIKVGYDSEARLGWASAWVGKEEVGAKSAPRKIKFQVMLQVPQDDINYTAVLVRVKKRWDL
eukprot:Gb_22926 [translate_table: standard]